MAHDNEFTLLQERRFLPFFITQFLGAFNDNVFKNALIILIAFQIASADPNRSSLLINLAAGLFVLPFFLFSATAGQLSDKYEKSRYPLGQVSGNHHHARRQRVFCSTACPCWTPCCS